MNNIVHIVPDDSIYTGNYEEKEGFGKCYICGCYSSISFTVNDKGQVIEESKECYDCKEEWSK